MKQPVKIAVLLVSVGIAIAAYRLIAPGSTAAPVPPPSARSTAAAPSLPEVSSAGTAGLIDPDSSRWLLRRQAPAKAVMEDIVANDLPANRKHAVRLKVTAVDPAKYWAAQMVKPVPQEVLANRNMVVRFWGRSARSTPIWLIFEEGKPPATPELAEKITLSPQWKEYKFPFRTKQDHVETHANFCIKAGIQPGEIEVSGIHVDEY